MNTAHLHPADAFTMPHPARHVHLYLAAIDGVIVAPVANRRPAACMRTGTSALQSDVTYTYGTGSDRALKQAGRVKTDDAPIPKTNEYGGKLTQTFDYDDLYRLVKADGVYTTAREVQNYEFAMAYDPIHNITHKTQKHTVSKIGGSPRTEAATSYDWAYTYKDPSTSGQAQTQPHAPTHIGERSFDYDKNGNQTGWKSDVNGTRRTIVWDEDNRIREVQDPKHGAAFTYDDQGERKLRKSQYGETAYINQFFTVRNGAIASTHVYAGTSRIVTKVGAGTPVGKSTNLNGTGNLSLTAPTGGSIVVADVTGGTTTATLPATAGSSTTNLSPASGRELERGQSNSGSFPGQGIAHRSDRANEVARNTEKNKHLNGGIPGGEHGAINSNAGGNGNAAGTSNNPGNTNTGDTGGTGGSNAGGNGGVGADNGSGGNTSGGGAGQGNGMEFIYFYHPDHLGSTGYVTDEKAQRYEHIAYFPFGETWVQESSATWCVPYQFTSKEMDSEMGLYYFGARYYDPRTSVWQSADPILAKYLPSGGTSDPSKLPGMGGIFNGVNLNLYAYAGHNPLRFIDPDGQAQVPSYQAVAAAYGKINDAWRPHFWSGPDSQRVADVIGGNLKKQHDANGLGAEAGDVNTCTIRLSYAINNSGSKIDSASVDPKGTKPVSGGDKKLNLLNVDAMIKYLGNELGAPTDSGRNPNENAKGGDNKGGISGMMDRIKGQKGIFVYQGALHGATGHASLWDGNKVVQQGSDYSDNPNMRAYFWKLPDATDK